MFGLHHSSSFSSFPAISLGITILLLLCSQLYLWASPSLFPAISLGFTFFVPSYISGLHLILLLCSQLYPWASQFFIFCVPSYISGFHLLFILCSQLFLWASPSSPFSAFPAISLDFTSPLLFLRCQLYLLALPFSFSCVPSYISGLHHYSSSSMFPAIYFSGLRNSSSVSVFPALGFTFFPFCLPSYISALHLLFLLRSQVYLWSSPFWVRFLRM